MVVEAKLGVMCKAHGIAALLLISFPPFVALLTVSYL